jgi:hypothetical protein
MAEPEESEIVVRTKISLNQYPTDYDYCHYKLGMTDEEYLRRRRDSEPHSTWEYYVDNS